MPNDKSLTSKELESFKRMQESMSQLGTKMAEVSKAQGLAQKRFAALSLSLSRSQSLAPPPWMRFSDLSPGQEIIYINPHTGNRSYGRLGRLEQVADEEIWWIQWENYEAGGLVQRKYFVLRHVMIEEDPL